MGIRRREPLVGGVRPAAIATPGQGFCRKFQPHGEGRIGAGDNQPCLLYTFDAADEEESVDPGCPPAP